MTKRIVSFLILLFSISNVATTQELKCNIQFVSEQVQGTNKKIFETLQQATYEFMNRSWTNHVFTPEERIECNLTFNIKDYSGSKFKGSLQVQSRRPTFNSSYSSTAFNYNDLNIEFDYVEFQALDFSESSFTSSLTSILAYYAYVIIGLDYDSFSPKGGSEYFKKAEIIVINAQSTQQKGWLAFGADGNKSRYWLTQNIMDEKYAPIREFNYKYHRLGLDRLGEKPSEAREQVLESLKLLQTVYRNKPDAYMHLLQVVIDAKNDEWVNVFSEGTPDEKTRAVQMLKEFDPTNNSKYQKIK